MLVLQVLDVSPLPPPSVLVLQVLDVPLVPELLHVRLRRLLRLPLVLRVLVLDELLQLLYPDLVQLQFLLFLFQDQQLLLFFQSPLLEFCLDVVYFFLPALFGFFAVLF